MWTPDAWGGRRHFCRAQAPYTVCAYAGSTEILDCPGIVLGVYDRTNWPTKYGSNTWVSPSDACRPGKPLPVRDNQVKDPTVVIRYIDGPRYLNEDRISMWVGSIGRAPDSSTDAFGNWYWHSNSNNVVLDDGHADQVKHPQPSCPWLRYWYSPGFVAGAGYGMEYRW